MEHLGDPDQAREHQQRLLEQGGAATCRQQGANRTKQGREVPCPSCICTFWIRIVTRMHAYCVVEVVAFIIRLH